MDHLKLTIDKLSVDEISELVLDSSCGAVSLFVGTTRDNFDGKKVVQLEYEAYEPMAMKALKAICDDLRQKWPELHGIAIYHRLGIVPAREASVVIAVSSPHRQASLSAVGACIEALKSSVPIWKKEVYGEGSAWKENVESPAASSRSLSPPPSMVDIDRNLVQINVSSEELQQRIQNFIDRKREQVNINNIHDFIPSLGAGDDDSCARVRTALVKRKDSKGHLKIRKVHNEWGPQTVHQTVVKQEVDPDLPPGIAERVVSAERYLNVSGPVPKDIYQRLRVLEERLAQLQALSPEYAQFWKSSNSEPPPPNKQDCIFSSSDIARKIEQLEKT